MRNCPGRDKRKGTQGRANQKVVRSRFITEKKKNQVGGGRKPGTGNGFDTLEVGFDLKGPSQDLWGYEDGGGPETEERGTEKKSDLGRGTGEIGGREGWRVGPYGP